MSFTPVTVTCRWTKAGPVDDVPASGQVQFQLTGPLRDSDDTQLPTAPVVARLDDTGSISVVLAATDDPTTRPTGVVYLVVENVDKATNRYYVNVPHDAAGGAVDLAALPRVNPSDMGGGGGGGSGIPGGLLLLPDPSIVVSGLVTFTDLGDVTTGHGTIIDGMSQLLIVDSPRTIVEVGVPSATVELGTAPAAGLSVLAVQQGTNAVFLLMFCELASALVPELVQASWSASFGLPFGAYETTVLVGGLGGTVNSVVITHPNGEEVAPGPPPIYESGAFQVVFRPDNAATV